MSDEMMFDPEEYLKSRWLKGSDLPAGKVTVYTIKECFKHTFERTNETKPCMSFYETPGQGVTIGRVQMEDLVLILGRDPRLWIGQRVGLSPAASNFPGKPTIKYSPAPSQVPGAKAAGIPPEDPDVLFTRGA